MSPISALTSVSLFQELARFFQFVLERVGASLYNAQLFSRVVSSALFLFQGGLHVLQLLLVALDVLLGFSVGLREER
ncbi:hypothetical protein M8J76_013360 [Diaphorina citri]|nr:hypothetical protein M8J76_013360 [Diaphorina citri]